MELLFRARYTCEINFKICVLEYPTLLTNFKIVPFQVRELLDFFSLLGHHVYNKIS